MTAKIDYYKPLTLDYGQGFIMSQSISRIRFVRRAQDLGFSLKEINELLGLRVDSQTICSDVKKRTQAKVLDIDEKMLKKTMNGRFVFPKQKKGKIKEVATESNLTCPESGFVQHLKMPTHSCTFSHQCSSCGATLKPKPGDCCVFCSYGDVACPLMQALGNEEQIDKQ